MATDRRTHRAQWLEILFEASFMAILCLMGQKVKNLVLQCAKSLSEQIQPNKSSAGLNPDGGCVDLTEIVIYYYLEISTNPT